MSTQLHSLLRRDDAQGDPKPRTKVDPNAGVAAPEDVHTMILFIVFGVIGASFVLTGIWFFFWAKNGGFYYKDGDWEEYKSTVLRRKGPNGTTLSGATTITDLGGGSVVHGQGKKSKKGKSIWGGTRATRSLWGGKKKSKVDRGKEKYSSVDYDEESELGTEQMIQVNPGAAHLRGGDLGRQYRDDDDDNETNTVSEPDMHSSVQEAIRSYRHEKPARVGGLNKESEASTWDGSTGIDGSMVSGTSSEAGLLKHQQSTPTNTPKKKKTARVEDYPGGNTSPKGRSNGGVASGIRKVVSTGMNQGKDTSGGFWSRKPSNPSPTKSTPKTKPTTEQIQSEARKLQEKGRASTAGAARRDFSFTRGIPDDATVVSGGTDSEDFRRLRRLRERAERREREMRTSQKVPGSWNGSVVGSDVSGTSSENSGTKAYPHVIPGLSATQAGRGAAESYKDERRQARGFRRDV